MQDAHRKQNNRKLKEQLGSEHLEHTVTHRSTHYTHYDSHYLLSGFSIVVQYLYPEYFTHFPTWYHASIAKLQLPAIPQAQITSNRMQFYLYSIWRWTYQHLLRSDAYDLRRIEEHWLSATVLPQDQLRVAVHEKRCQDYHAYFADIKGSLSLLCWGNIASSRPLRRGNTKLQGPQNLLR